MNTASEAALEMVPSKALTVRPDRKAVTRFVTR